MTARRLVTFTYVLALYGGLIAASQPAVAGALRAGVAKIDVTPPADTPLAMSGYGSAAREPGHQGGETNRSMNDVPDPFRTLPAPISDADS